MLFLDQKCGAPESLPDAIAASAENVTGVSQGQQVKYLCRTGRETATSVCLSDGQWDHLGYVCGGNRGWDQKPCQLPNA